MEAEDLCHDIFVEVIDNPSQYDPARGSLEAWLAVKTKSRCLDRLRKKQTQKQKWTKLLSPLHQGESLEEQVVTKWQAEMLHHAMEKIPAPQKRAVLGLYFQEKTQRELAEKMQRPLGTVKSLIRYGLNNLRKQLNQWGIAEPSGGAKKHE
jgi:RNA polymerase sigma-70 factor (ECF subfamily)